MGNYFLSYYKFNFTINWFFPSDPPFGFGCISHYCRHFPFLKISCHFRFSLDSAWEGILRVSLWCRMSFELENLWGKTLLIRARVERGSAPWIGLTTFHRKCSHWWGKKKDLRNPLGMWSGQRLFGRFWWRSLGGARYPFLSHWMVLMCSHYYRCNTMRIDSDILYWAF